MKIKRSQRIVIATIGSLGDLHPCLALAQELQRRGHVLTVASTDFYRAKVEELQLAFVPIRPHWDPTDRELIRQCEDLRRGPEVLYREMILPELRGTYVDLLAAADGADLMIAGELVYAAPLVAEKLQLRWVSAILSPFSFFSAHDPSVMVNAPWLIHFRKFSWQAYRLGLDIGRLATRHWSNPVRLLRREIGLKTKCDPVFRDKFSPDLVLALFSRLLAQPQPDWPSQTLQPGFVFLDRNSSENQAAELKEFLAAGDPPIVFTQGSTAVHNSGNFYDTSVKAAQRLHRRAVLLGTRSLAPGVQSTEALALPYVDYAEIFRHAAVNVHQGGSGTVGQAMQSGRPMLVVPYGWDQPDNASRVERLGTGVHLPRSEYSVTTATAALERLLGEERFARKAEEVGCALQSEDGLNAACNAIESVLAHS